MWRPVVWIGLWIGVLAGACDDGGSAPDEAMSSDAAPDAAPDATLGPLDGGMADAGRDAAPVDAAIDAFVGDMAWLPLDPALVPPPPAPLRAGVAIHRMPVPLGIGTSGYGPSQARGYITPFQVGFPGTRRIHLHPDFRVVVLEAGARRLYFIRTDTIGISAQIRRDLVARLEARYGPGADQQLVISATHTHSGPGRLIDKPLWRLIQDAFWPELYARVVDGLEAAVVAAVDDLEPARVGHGTAQTTLVHGDRRCQNDEEDDPDFPVVRIDRADGRLKALMLFHTVHGTALNLDDYTLSQDISGGIEAKVAERFEEPVMVIFLNGAAADMSPGSPQFPPAPAAPELPRGYTQTETVGRAAADAVLAVVGGIETRAEAVLFSRTARTPINRAVLGYEEGFFPHEYGAVYCGAGASRACQGEVQEDNLLLGCLPFPDVANSAPTQAPLTVGQIGDFGFITTPGEFSVSLGRRAAEAASAAIGLPVVVIGYAQEYTGYSLEEADWWQGGYEASGALWGPRQGDYLADSIVSLAHSYANPRLPLAFADQAPLPVAGPYAFEPWPVMVSARAAEVIADVPRQADAGTLLRFEFSGGDPWLGNPVVTLERANDDRFEPVHLGGRPVTSDGYVITLELEPEPTYREEADARTFRWIALLPIGRPFGGGPALAGGRFRLVATGRSQTAADRAPQAYTVISRPFAVPQ